MDKTTTDTATLVGIGLYTPAEASRLIHVASGKIVRWLKGHEANGKWYERLWKPQVDLGDGKVYLGFRDLMEMRTAAAFMEAGVSAVAIRRAITAARELLDDDHPLSTTQFRTDGRTIFLEIAGANDDAKLLDLFRNQFAFKRIIELSLKGVEFEGIAPSRWWPMSRDARILVDPERSFGQPIEADTGVPTAILASAARAEGSIDKAAMRWNVPAQAIRRAIRFEEEVLEAA